MVQKSENNAIHVASKVANNPAVNKVISNNAGNVLRQIKDNGGKPLPGYISKIFQNRKGLLPKAGKYMEHDIKPLMEGVNRGGERLVIDANTGRSWYTSTHYESFVEIK